MSLKEIIDRFTLVSGLEMKDVSRFLPIIADCKAFFEERMSEELSDADRRRMIHACAVYAFYRVSLMGKLDDLVSFKVGDVQMNVEQVGAAAQKLWETERENIADLIDFGGGFAFRSVRV